MLRFHQFFLSSSSAVYDISFFTFQENSASTIHVHIYILILGFGYTHVSGGNVVIGDT